MTAEGDVLDVTDESHPDLMWALRGGGGNFGVAASFVYRLRPQPMVVGGLIAHPIDAAGDLLRFYRDAAANCPDELTVFAGARARAGRLGDEARGDVRVPHRPGATPIATSPRSSASARR